MRTKLREIKHIIGKGIVVIMVFAILAFVILRTPNNKHFSKEVNASIKHLVKQVLQVRPYTSDGEVLEEIFTEELLQNFEYYHPYFLKEETFYLISRNYMQTLHKDSKDEWVLYVRIHEGWWDSSSWLYITVIQDEANNYRVSSVVRNK